MPPLLIPARHGLKSFHTPSQLDYQLDSSLEAQSTSKIAFKSHAPIRQLHKRSEGDDAAIIGLVLGIVFFVVVLSIVAYVYWWRASTLRFKSSASQQKRDKRKKREMKARRKAHSEKRRLYYDYRRRAHRRRGHAYRHSPVSNASHFEWPVGIQSYGMDDSNMNMYPSAAQRHPSMWQDTSQAGNEMDAPQMTYSNDNLAAPGVEYGYGCPHWTFLPTTHQPYQVKERRSPYRRRWSWSS